MNKLSEDQERIVKYFQDHMANGKYFFKSKYVGKDLGMSAREIGTNIGLISKNETTNLRVYKWSESNSFTWRAEFRKPTN